MRTSLVRTIDGDDGKHRAEIFDRDDGTFEVEIVRWHQEFVEGYGRVGDPFWLPVSKGKSICASLELAKARAVELLDGFAHS